MCEKCIDLVEKMKNVAREGSDLLILSEEQKTCLHALGVYAFGHVIGDVFDRMGFVVPGLKEAANDAFNEHVDGFVMPMTFFLGVHQEEWMNLVQPELDVLIETIQSRRERKEAMRVVKGMLNGDPSAETKVGNVEVGKLQITIEGEGHVPPELQAFVEDVARQMQERFGDSISSPQLSKRVWGGTEPEG